LQSVRLVGCPGSGSEMCAPSKGRFTLTRVIRWRVKTQWRHFWRLYRFSV